MKLKEYNITFVAEEEGDLIYSFTSVKTQTFNEAVREAYTTRHKRGLNWTIESIILKRS